MVFEIPAAGARLKKNRFEFKLGDETVSVPKLEFIPAEAEDYLEEVNGKGLSMYRFVIGFIASFDPDLGKKLHEARLSRDQITDLYAAWGASSKVSTGESSASESS
ncbi:hypothetical protein [Nocardia vulneris]|uniref:Tail assembly chaperone n=1 Tax=Nocardia vulneris TaxID=1141657 RepID=A0ABR4ZCL3_9NOCA|nr:hypothetical protein [Nocardia vulneris]KIA63001.1 hypothetical protein FG87_21740 [Nocardia vulneris]